MSYDMKHCAFSRLKQQSSVIILINVPPPNVVRKGVIFWACQRLRVSAHTRIDVMPHVHMYLHHIAVPPAHMWQKICRVHTCGPNALGATKQAALQGFNELLPFH